MTREEAIEQLKQIPIHDAVSDDYMKSIYDAIDMAIKALEQEPCEDAISRQAVMDCFKKWQSYMATRLFDFEKELKSLPSVTPKTEWIPLKTRPMTEEETEHYFEYTDMRIDDTYTILDCTLPDDGQEVLVSLGGNVVNDVFIQDSEGCYFEGVDIDEVDAWMPLPEPYKAESEVQE